MMTHEEMQRINEQLRTEIDNALFDARDVIGVDAICIYWPFKGRKGQIMDIYVDEGAVMLTFQAYKKTATGLSSKFISSTVNLHVNEIVLCEDKAQYAKYLLTS